MASALAFATGDAEQSAPASAGAGAAMSGRFSEAPMLAARVAAGELPPVDERIPVDPVVQEMLGDGVGRYGGTLRVSEAVGFMNQRGGDPTTQMLDIYLLTMHLRRVAPGDAGLIVRGERIAVRLRACRSCPASSRHPGVEALLRLAAQVVQRRLRVHRRTT